MPLCRGETPYIIFLVANEFTVADILLPVGNCVFQGPEIGVVDLQRWEDGEELMKMEEMDSPPPSLEEGGERERKREGVGERNWCKQKEAGILKEQRREEVYT